MCDCIERWNEKLAVENLRLELFLLTDSKTMEFRSTLAIATQTLPGHFGAPYNIATVYCPFCGNKY